jgi:zinc protease
MAPGWDWPTPRLENHVLPSGLRVYLAPMPAIPLVWMSLVAHAGIECDSPETAGSAALTPLLFREGSARRDAARITDELEDLGAHLGLGCDWDSAFLSLEMLATDLPAGAELLFDMAWGARFPDEALERLRQRRLAELSQRARQPGTRADDEFARAVHGHGTYGRAPLGTSASLPALTSAQLAAFHARHYQPTQAYVVLAGAFDSQAVLELLAAFDPPRASASAPPPAFIAAAQASPGWRAVDAPRAAQTELRLGHEGVARDNPDLPALELLATLLGGGPCSRLAASLRQRLGLTYHARSRFLARRHGGPFLIETRVANGSAVQAVAAIEHELERLRDEFVPAEELEQTRRSLLGLELRRVQCTLEFGMVLAQAAAGGDPAGHLAHKRAALAALEPAGLRELARRYLRPEQLVKVVVGPLANLSTPIPGDAPAGQTALVTVTSS